MRALSKRGSWSRYGLGLAAGWAMLLGLSCGQNPVPSAEQLLRGARDGYARAPTYHVAISFTQDARHYRLDLDVNRPDAAGTDEVDGTSVDVVYAGGIVYRRGQAFFRAVSGERVAKLAGDSWVRSSDPQLVAGFSQLVSVSLLDDFRGDHPNLRARGSSSVHGYRTTRLSDGRTTVYVASPGAAYPIRIDDPLGKLVGLGATDVTIDFFDFGRPQAVSAPGGWVDFNDPATLPALFVATEVSHGACDSEGCDLAATLRNDGGPGASTADFIVESAGTTVDTCTVPVAATPNKATQRISCRIASGAWTGWVDGHPGADFTYRIRPHNPAYE